VTETSSTEKNSVPTRTDFPKDETPSSTKTTKPTIQEGAGVLVPENSHAKSSYHKDLVETSTLSRDNAPGIYQQTRNTIKSTEEPIAEEETD
jgi:hypothetical protein